jgi:hypothetical protein
VGLGGDRVSLMIHTNIHKHTHTKASAVLVAPQQQRNFTSTTYIRVHVQMRKAFRKTKKEYKQKEEGSNM